MKRDFTLMEKLLCTKPDFSEVETPEDRRLWRSYCWERAVEAEAKRRGIWDDDSD
jgi:hypothetical protein